jgi:hypothetical protein
VESDDLLARSEEPTTYMGGNKNEDGRNYIVRRFMVFNSRQI